MINSEVLSWAHCDGSKPGCSAARYMLISYILNRFMEINDQVLGDVLLIVFTFLHTYCTVNGGYCIQQWSMQIV